MNADDTPTTPDDAAERFAAAVERRAGEAAAVDVATDEVDDPDLARELEIARRLSRQSSALDPDPETRARARAGSWPRSPSGRRTTGLRAPPDPGTAGVPANGGAGAVPATRTDLRVHTACAVARPAVLSLVMAPHQTLARRLRPVIPSVLVALLAVSGCGGASPSAPQGVFPATVTHQYGQTVVEEAPDRVVSLGSTDQDAILALGTVPVAVREFAAGRPATWPWETARLQGEQPQVLPAGDIDPQAVAALKPDLIVAINAGLTREQYDALSRIAPTIAGPAGTGTGTGAVPWQDATRLTGAALGLPDQADRLVNQVEDQFLEAEEKYPELAGATIAAVRPSDTDPASFMAWSSQDLRGRFLIDLGMQLPDDVDRLAGQGSYAMMPAQQLTSLDRSDALMVIGTDAQRQAFTTLPGYSQLQLVQQSKVVSLDDEQSAALAFNTVLSLPSVLDELTGRLSRAIER